MTATGTTVDTSMGTLSDYQTDDQYIGICVKAYIKSRSDDR